MGKRGPKPGTGGRPKTSLYDRIQTDNPGKRPISVLDEAINHKDQDLKPPIEVLQNERALEMYNRTVDWLKTTNCLGFIYPELIAEYAMAKARYWQCEANNSKSLLSKHPTTQQPMQSPFVDIAVKYAKLAEAAWEKIWNIVKENSTVDFKIGAPVDDDPMEALLRSRSKGR